MTKRDIAILSLKILAIYAFFLAIPFFSYSIMIIVSLLRDPIIIADDLLQLIFTLGPLLSYLLCAIFLWRKSVSLSCLMTTGMDKYESKSTVSGRTLHLIAFSILGLYFIIHAIPDLIPLIVKLFTLPKDRLGADDLYPTDWKTHMNSFIRLIIGLWLFLKPQSVLNIWNRFQKNPYEEKFIDGVPESFIQTAESWIRRYDEVFAVTGHLASGGNREYALLGSAQELSQLIKTCPPGTDIIIFQDPQLAHRGIVDQEFIKSVTTGLQNEKKYLYVEIESATDDNPRLAGSEVPANELPEVLKTLEGKHIAVGPCPPLTDADNESIISTTVRSREV